MAIQTFYLCYTNQIMNPDYASLRSYIESQRQNGVVDTIIYQNLVASGWPETTIKQFLSTMQQQTNYQNSNSVQNPPIQPINNLPQDEFNASSKSYVVACLLSFFFRLTWNRSLLSWIHGTWYFKINYIRWFRYMDTH